MKTAEDNFSTPAVHLWHVRMLGRLEVASSSNDLVRFRSRTALSLLAFLSLHKSKEWIHEHLQEHFWPDSDGDRQAQNLRRAVADLRSVLEYDLPLGSVVVTRKNHVALNPDRVATDVERFLALTLQAPDRDEQDCLAEAVSLYSGPLLAPLSDEWVMGHRMELEERFGQAVDRLCSTLVRRGKAKEAIRIGRSAAVAAPLREDVHVALIGAYNAAGMSTEALRQFEELERLLDDNWGEVPSDRARQALEAQPVSELHSYTSHVDQQAEPEPSGGAMPLASRYYVRRAADVEAEACLERGEGVVLVQGPRQVGKSSLLARALAHARSASIAVVLSDLQAMGESQLLEEGPFYKTLAHSLSVQLGLDLDIDDEWKAWLGSNMNLDAVLGKLLAKCDGPVCWGIDEADMLFDRPYTNDFFGLLRSWHNRRALEPDGPWKRLTLILTYATEAHLFISDLNQSPFNVGVRLALRDLSEEEVRALQAPYGLVQPDAWRRVSEITHGHPYLSQCAFAFLAHGGTIEELTAKASHQDGPFGSHLARLITSIAQNEQTLGEVRRLLRGQSFEHPTTRYRLQSAGLITLSWEGKVEFRVPIYGDFLRAEIG